MTTLLALRGGNYLRADEVLAVPRAFSKGHMKLAYPYQGEKPAPFTPRHPEDVTSPQLRKALALWRARCPAGGELPAAGGFDILDYQQVVRSLNLIEVREPPLDFVFRVHAVTGADYVGQDMTGRSVWDYPDRHYGGYVREVCRRAKLERTPQIAVEEVLVRHKLMSYDRPYRWEALMLPLQDDAGRVSRLIFVFDLIRLS